MKALISAGIVSLLIILYGCSEPVQSSGDSTTKHFPDTPAGRRDMVVYEMRTNEVVALAGQSISYHSYNYIVRTTDGSIWYVYISSGIIYEKIHIFGPANQTTMVVAKPEQ